MLFLWNYTVFFCTPAVDKLETNMFAIFVTFTVLFALVANFLGFELLKKFNFMRMFTKNSNQMVEWEYPGDKTKKPGMRNIVLRGQRPFSVLIGFNLKISLIGHNGFDYYGFAQADEKHMVVISTYLGKKPCIFQFFVNTDLAHNHIGVSSNDWDQELNPDVSFPPHWYQRLGFYG